MHVCGMSDVASDASVIKCFCESTLVSEPGSGSTTSLVFFHRDVRSRPRRGHSDPPFLFGFVCLFAASFVAAGVKWGTTTQGNGGGGRAQFVLTCVAAYVQSATPAAVRWGFRRR